MWSRAPRQVGGRCRSDSTRLGRNPASVLPAPVGAISSAERPALRLRQQFELMRARRPAAAGEPAREHFRKQRRLAVEQIHRGSVAGTSKAVECNSASSAGDTRQFARRTAPTATMPARASPSRCGSRLVRARAAPSRRRQRIAHMSSPWAIAQRRPAIDALARMGLDREGDSAAGASTRRDGGEHRSEILDIDEHIGRDDQSYAAASAVCIGEKRPRCRRPRAGRRAPFACALRDHRRRQIDADEPIDIRTERRAGKPGAAAEIEHRCKRIGAPERAQRGARHRAAAPGRDNARFRSARRRSAAAYWSNSRAHIGCSHRRRGRAGAEPRKLQPRAVIILRVGAARRFECRDRAVAVAEPIADGAERKPGGGKRRAQSPRSAPADRRRRKVAAAPHSSTRGTCSAGRRSGRRRMTNSGPVIGHCQCNCLSGSARAAVDRDYLSLVMRPEDILMPPPAGRLLPARRLPYRSDPAGRERAVSPMAIPTTRAPATARCWRRRRRST